jgi:hypoxanthine phosphoribosyltransferase
MSTIEVLIPAAEIRKRVEDLGAQISADYQGRTVVLVGVLKGSFMFIADLVRNLTCPVRLEFIGTRSYDIGSSTSGQVQLTKDLDKPIEGEDVLLVEDIIDTGLTLTYLYQLLAQRQPRSLKTVAFLDKPSRRKIAAQGNYIGFTIEDKFVVGYGLDYEQRYRNLKDLCVLTP